MMMFCIFVVFMHRKIDHNLSNKTYATLIFWVYTDLSSGFKNEKNIRDGQ